MNWLKRTVGALPPRWQQEFRKWWFRYTRLRGRFTSPEPEFDRLDRWVTDGDWVLDIGANVGHYALRLSRIVGPGGRVLAFEPVPQTFELLTANIQWAGCTNVTLFNVAVSRETALHGIDIPESAGGGRNYYRAELRDSGPGLQVMSIAVDGLAVPERIALAKIDVEGHELSVLQGMESLLMRDHPVLIVEGRDEPIASYLRGLGYAREELEGSPNCIYSKP